MANARNARDQGLRQDVVTEAALAPREGAIDVNKSPRVVLSMEIRGVPSALNWI